MVSVSLCMIVRDEEQVLSRCLDSVREAVDEIVIVDTGSLDRTKEIAWKYTDRVLISYGGMIFPQQKLRFFQGLERILYVAGRG